MATMGAMTGSDAKGTSHSSPLDAGYFHRITDYAGAAPIPDGNFANMGAVVRAALGQLAAAAGPGVRIFNAAIAAGDNCTIFPFSPSVVARPGRVRRSSSSSTRGRPISLRYYA